MRQTGRVTETRIEKDGDCDFNKQRRKNSDAGNYPSTDDDGIARDKERQP